MRVNGEGERYCVSLTEFLEGRAVYKCNNKLYRRVPRPARLLKKNPLLHLISIHEVSVFLCCDVKRYYKDKRKFDLHSPPKTKMTTDEVDSDIGNEKESTKRIVSEDYLASAS